MLATPSCTQTLLLFPVAAPIVKDPAFLARVSSSLCIPDFLCPIPPRPRPLRVVASFFSICSFFVDKRRQMKVCAVLVTSCSSWTFCLFVLTRVSVSDFLPPTPLPCFLPSLREGGGPCCSDHFCRLTSGSSQHSLSVISRWSSARPRSG